MTVGSVAGDDEGVLALLQRASEVYEREKAALQAACLGAETLLHTSHTGQVVLGSDVARRACQGSDEHPAFRDETFAEPLGSTGDKHSLRSLADAKIVRPLPLQNAAPAPTSPVPEMPSQEDGDGTPRKRTAPAITSATSVTECTGAANSRNAEGTEGSEDGQQLLQRHERPAIAENDLALPGEAFGKNDSAADDSQQAMMPALTEPSRPWHSAVNKLRLDQQASEATTTPNAIIAKMKSTLSRRGSASKKSEKLTLEVYPVWQKIHFRAKSQVRVTRFQKMQKFIGKRCQPSRFTTPPNAGRVLAWNMVGMVCIAYDMVMIPLGFFDVPSSPGTIALGLCVTSFWTLDTMLRFFVGYNKANGLVERRLSRIACRYVRTWFIPDMALVVVDWLVFLGESGADTLGLMRLGKTLRTTRSLKLMRQARLLRLMKVEGHMRHFFDVFNSEKTATIAKMTALMFFVVICTHFIAFGWYGLTKFQDSEILTWVKYHLEQDGQSPDWVYLYTTSLHWSITQFTPASMEVYPHNNAERIVNIFVVFFALVVFTSLVSSVTSSMTFLNDMTSEESSKKMKLRHWLSENSVSIHLVSRVWAAVRLSLKNKNSRMPMKDVSLLAELPKNVMAEVQEEIFKPVIADHPFFLRYLNRNRAGMRRIFNCTVGELSLDLGEELFAEGDPADRMFFVRSGTLYYEISRQESETVLRMPHRASYILRHRERRGQGDWCSEVALWAHWTYRGALTATNAVELLTVEGASFRTVMTGFVKTDGVLSTYATEFAEAAYEHWRILDIWCDKEVAEEMSWKAFQQCDSWDEEDSEEGSLLGESEAESAFSPSEAVNPWSPVLQRQQGNWAKERPALSRSASSLPGLNRSTSKIFG